MRHRLLSRAVNRLQDVLFTPGACGYWMKKLRGTVTTLIYHRVDERPADFLSRGGVPTIHPKELASDIRFLLDSGCELITYRELFGNKRLSSSIPYFILTFDDGFRDTYVNGMRVLDTLGVRAVFFQTTSMVDSFDLIWEHALYFYIDQSVAGEALTKYSARLLGEGRHKNEGTDWEMIVRLRDTVYPGKIQRLLEVLGKERDDAEHRCSLAREYYPSSDLLREAVSRGHELGSHGHSHYARRLISASEFEREFRVSKQLIEEVADTVPSVFAFPFGSLENQDTIPLSRYYRHAATTCPGRVKPGTTEFLLPRFPWPGPARNVLRHRRWLATGEI